MLKIFMLLLCLFLMAWDIASAARHHKDGHYYMFGVDVALACIMLIQLAKLHFT